MKTTDAVHEITSISPIRIVLADDNEIVRSSLRLLFDSYPDLDLIGEASDGFEAISICTSLQPDLVLMDIDMPFVDGVQATRVLRDRFPEMYILAFAAINDNGKRSLILQSGANCLIHKQITADELINKIIDREKSNSGKRTVCSDDKQ
jgi:DNA-binding NarL/FixJ family response regulator